MSPIPYTLYGIPILLAVLIVSYEYLSNKKRNLRINKKRIFNLNSELINKFGKIISKSDYLEKLKEYYASRLGLINQFDKQTNRSIVVLGMAGTFVAALIVTLVVSKLFFMWYMILLCFGLTIFTSMYVFNFAINRRLGKVYSQFPLAIQVFTDEYITTKNIKNSLMNTYYKMPKEISNVFERLTRELTSTGSAKEPLLEFANSLQYVWAYAFAQLLITSYEGAGDISDELLYLNDLVNEDIRATEETKSELASNKIMFILFSVITVVGFIFNIFYSPLGADIYFYTTLGNQLILGWVFVFALGLGTLVVMEKW